MQTVFSHIVNKELSRQHENIATESLAYIVRYSTSARSGLTKLVGGVVPDLPDLRFQTQETAGDNCRPDMWGYDRAEPRVFIESKFWAALTDKQPVVYLNQLATHTQPTALLVVVPDGREGTLWRELRRRLAEAKIKASELHHGADIVCAVVTDRGPILALTNWTKLLSALEREARDDQRALSDLLQLRALCAAADADIPISSADVMDQRTPALILQLGSIVQAAVDQAVGRGTLYVKKWKAQADWERMGRYATFTDEHGAGVWLGVDFDLWKAHGESPLWAVFSTTDWGRAREVRPLLEPWAIEKGLREVTLDDDSFAVALDIPFGQERDQVVRWITDRLNEMEAALSNLRPRRRAKQHV